MAGKKVAVGRPSKYKREYCEMLIEHLDSGLSFESFAGLISVNRDTLYEWTRKHVEFSDAKKIGVEKGVLFWEKVARSAIMGQIPNCSNSTLIFTLKNRLGWHDRQGDSLNDSKFEPVIIELPIQNKSIKIANKKA